MLHISKKRRIFGGKYVKKDTMVELKHPIREAERYLQNAKQILSEKAEKDGDYYNDSKYVRMAGNTAWGYDGNPRYKIVQDSLEQARYIIDWADKHYQN
jgi:hypothetical protein